MENNQKNQNGRRPNKFKMKDNQKISKLKTNEINSKWKTNKNKK